MESIERLRETAARTECANGRCERLYRGDLDHIADAIEQEVAERYVALPLDADGVPIRMGDEMTWVNGTFTVHKLRLTETEWTTWDSRHGYTVQANECRHVQPDTWERIIRDAIQEGIERAGCGLDRADGIDNAFLVERCKALAGEVGA